MKAQAPAVMTFNFVDQQPSCRTLFCAAETTHIPSGENFKIYVCNTNIHPHDDFEQIFHFTVQCMEMIFALVYSFLIYTSVIIPVF